MLVTQGGDRERGIVPLMRAGEGGERKSEFPARIAIVQRAALNRAVPFAALYEQGRAGERGHLLDARGGFRRMREGDEGNAGLGNPGLFAGDVGERGAEPLLVIKAKRGDGGRRRPRHEVGGVEAAAHAHLQHQRIGRRAAEGEKGGGRGRLEEARLDAFADVENFVQQAGQEIVTYQPAGEANTLVKAHQMGRGEDVGGKARCLQRRAEKGGGRPLAVGAGNVEHRRKLGLRIAEAFEQFGDALQPETVAAGRQRLKPGEG
jgi:hypothetical protein